MDEPAGGIDWETLIAELLDELSGVQDDLLETLSAKRDAMAAGRLEQLEPLQQQERELGRRLEACHRRRAKLLAEAAAAGLPGDSVASLAGATPTGGAELERQVQQVAARTRLLRHQSLTNWVLAQRSLLHLSQLLEILATGGQTEPTYSKEESLLVRGNLVDRAA